MISDTITCTRYDITLLHAPFIFEENRQELFTMNSEIKDIPVEIYIEDQSINGIMDNGANLSYISESALHKLELFKKLKV